MSNITRMCVNGRMGERGPPTHAHHHPPGLSALFESVRMLSCAGPMIDKRRGAVGLGDHLLLVSRCRLIPVGHLLLSAARRATGRVSAD
jgi:hypothetical protein